MTNWTNHQAEAFRNGSTEDVLTDPIQRSRLVLTLDCIKSNQEILDLGANHGHISQEIWAKGNKVTAVDLPDVVAIGKKKFPDLEWKALDLDEKFAHCFNNRKYDIIIASELIEHLIDIDQFLDECIKLLKADGKLIVSTPNVARPANVAQMLKGYVVSGFFSHIEEPLHIRFYTLWTLKDTLKRHGFYDLGFAGAYTGNDYYDRRDFSEEECKFLDETFKKRKYPQVSNASIICTIATRPK